MSDCRDVRKGLREFIEGGGDGRIGDTMKEHIQDCPECRRTADEVRRIMNGTESVREELRDVMAGIDWDALPERIAAAAFAQKKPARTPAAARAFWRPLFQRPYLPVAATLLVGIALGAVATLLVLKPAGPPAGARYFLSPDLIDRAELQLAKRETLDYLDRSQYLILDFVQSEPGPSRRLAQDQASFRLRNTLEKKRYINQHLDEVQMAKAREICDQIEILLLELSQISGELTVREKARIKAFIEQKQILLKIKLLRKELQESEV